MVLVVNNKVKLARVLKNSYIFVIETKVRAWLRNKFEIRSIQWSKLCTRVFGSPEIWRIWKVFVTHSFTWEMKTRLGRVSRVMSRVFACLHNANEALCDRCGAHLGPQEGKFWFCTGPNNRLSSRAR